MRNRTRVIAAAAAVTAALAGGSAAALASTGNAEPGTPAKLVSAHGKPGGATAPSQTQVHNAMVAAVARKLHLSTARVSAALQPLFAAGHADTSSPAFAAAAHALGVSAQQLNTALIDAKESLVATMHVKQRQGGSKSKTTAPQNQGNNAMVTAVAEELHLSTARVSAALQPLLAAGQADPSSPTFAAAARALGVSTQQLATALTHAKQSLAEGS